MSFADAALEDAIKASCKVITPMGQKSAVGSGVCIANTNDVWALTNAHVVNDGSTHYTEWYWEGHKSARVPAVVVWKKYQKAPSNVDLALLRIDAAWFGGRLPTAARLVPADYVAPKGTMLYTVGCPGGAAPTALRSQLAGYEKGRAGMMLIPKVEFGRSGSGVFDETGSWLLGIVDTCDPSTGQYKGPYGYAIYASQIRKLLEPMVRQEPRLFGGSFCRGGFCGNQAQQQVTPPGTGQAYPDLPPLPGMEDQLPIAPVPAPEEVDNLRERIEYLELTLRDVTTDLVDKEQRLQALFGEDYTLLKQMAADAKAAKTAADMAGVKAEDAKTSVGILTGAVLDMPATVAAQDAEIENKFGVIRDTIAAWKADPDKEKAELKAKVEKIGAIVEKVQRVGPWSLMSLWGWPSALAGVLGIGGIFGYRRIAKKVKNGEELLAQKFAPNTTAAVVGAAGHVKDHIDDAMDRLLGEARAARIEAAAAEGVTKAKEIIGGILK